METAILIVTYNDYIMTFNTIASIKKKYNSKFSITIYVLDNSIDKNISEILKKNEKNIGYIYYSLGLNAGYLPIIANIYEKIREKYDYIILSNNDIIYDKKFFQELAQYKINTKEYLIAPLIIRNSDKSNQNPLVVKKISKIRKMMYSIYYYSYIFAKTIDYIYPKLKKILNLERKDYKNQQDGIEIYMAFGACMILTKEFIKNNDSIYAPVFLMGEEAVLAYQIRKTGGKIIYKTKLKVYHYDNYTISKIDKKKKYFITRDSYKKYRKYI